MKKDIYQPYDNTLLPNGEWLVNSLVDDANGLMILLTDSKLNVNVHVKFDSPISYRNTNESYLLKLWSEFEGVRTNTVLHIVQNSTFCDYFNEMSLNIYNDWEVQHYAILTSQDCIDVLSLTKPKLEWRESS